MNITRYVLICYCCCLISVAGNALSAQDSLYRLSIIYVDQPIQIDGEIDEADWQRAAVASDFWIQTPVDGERAQQRTEVRLVYDQQNLYLAAILYDDPNYVIQTLKRDRFGDSDEFGVIFDPVNQRANGYAFGVNVMGVQSEALITADDADESWDNRWWTATQRYDDRWTVEMAIPFKSLRFEDGKQLWGINFVRLEPGSNEIHVWAPVPRQFAFYDLGYTGTLVWEEPPARTGSNISLIPYVSARLDQDLHDEHTSVGEVAAGGDAKIALSPTLNLDLTYNPDFSQVEVDAQVTNLTRFNIFFPERRQFFIENGDVFNSFGHFGESPFYSRRIGLDAAGNTVPILYGARLTGNVTEKLRVGAFNIHTRGDEQRYAQNYSAVTFQQRLWERSAIKGIFLNRQAFADGEWQSTDYGRNLGGEFFYTTADGRWLAKAGYLQSFKAGFDDKRQHIYGRFDYNGQRFRTFLAVQQMGENYFADMGFTGRLFNFDPETNEVVRVGFTQISNMLNYYIYPKESEKVNFHWSGLENFVYINPDGTLNEWYTRLRHFFVYKNTSQLRFRINNNYVDLLFPFALTDVPLPATSYNMLEFNVQFNTDIRRRIAGEMNTVYGQFYGGTKLTYSANLQFRAQPWGTFSLGLERNQIWLPDPYGNLGLTLAVARAEVNFSNSLFWTTFLQYNTQADNFNVNSRLQWRFAPMSDLYLVYTDNYQVANLFGPKTRSLVLKLNYWLTL